MRLIMFNNTFCFQVDDMFTIVNHTRFVLSPVKSCTDLSPVANGVYSPSTGPYTEYDEVTFACDIGYYLSAGEPLFWCIEKEWSNAIGEVPLEPTCTGKLLSFMSTLNINLCYTIGQFFNYFSVKSAIAIVLIVMIITYCFTLLKSLLKSEC